MNKIMGLDVGKKRINHRLLITAYLLNNSGRENIAGMVYSLSDPSDYKYIFLDNMLKKSIYECRFSRTHFPDDSQRKVAIFKRSGLAFNGSTQTFVLDIVLFTDSMILFKNFYY